MKYLSSKIKQFIWTVKHIYWNRMKITLDTFSGGTREIEMNDIVSVAVTIINGVKQICIILRGEPEALYFPLTAHNLSWFQGFIIHWTNNDICALEKNNDNSLGLN